MSYSVNETLHQLIHAYKKQLRISIQEQRIDLPVNHIRVLKGIGKYPQSTARSIALRMNQDKAQITRVLNELVQSKLIKKTDNPNDRRSQFLTPTASGKKILEKVHNLETEVIAVMTHNLSEKELKAFAHIASVMIENLTEHPTSD
ncbi:MarR family winged helix-turn-helix transcriptional regulator [Microbulbifer sp. DLAB2-AA]|uniref:MarR family winged helix-turn-helix transcriptional regulator n=1 Tax=Microbulbifer sp. DLAB2-AA TaxID=3243394 RepID=UPI00403A6AC0